MIPAPREAPNIPRTPILGLKLWRSAGSLEGFFLEFSGEIARTPPCTLEFSQSRFLGRGCDEALFTEKKQGFSVKRGGQFSESGVVRISAGKAMQ